MEMAKKHKKTNIFVELVRIILLIILFPFVLIFFIKKDLDKKSSVSFDNLSQVDALSGEEFESFLSLLFKKMGYVVSLTKKTGDFGVDLILKKNNNQFIVQAKRYSRCVGVHAVQEIVAARNHYKIFDAMVVSNQEFSNEAKKLAQESGVELIGRKKLSYLIEQYNIDFDGFSYKFSALSASSKQQMMSKYKYWI